jgi:hypothetical protein
MELINHLENCFTKAQNGESKLTKKLLALDGMSGNLTRHFYNNLLEMEGARYLEIGTWKGSSVCSAMYKNQAIVVCIDNWSEFGAPKDDFLANFKKYKGKNQAKFIEGNCFELDLTGLPKFNIYLYDGGHSVEDQSNAITYFIDCLDDVFILIIDDWNWSWVRTGTYLGIEKANLKTLWAKEIILTENDEHTEAKEAKETWWNGMGVFLLQKQNDRTTDI